MIIVKNLEIHSFKNRDMINDTRKHFTIEDELQEAQAINPKHSVPCKEVLTVNLSEGDAKEQIINESTPRSAKGQRQEDITEHSEELMDRAPEYTVISEHFSEKSRNLRNNMEDSDHMKDSEENVLVRSSRISKNITFKNPSLISEKSRLGATPRLMPRQAEDTLPNEIKDSSERLALGFTTTRLSPRQVVECCNQENCEYK